MIKNIIERSLILLFIVINLSSCQSIDKGEDDIIIPPNLVDVFGIYEGVLTVETRTMSGETIQKTDLPKQYVQVRQRSVENELLLFLANFVWEDEDLGNIDVPALYTVIDDNNCELEAYRQLYFEEYGQANINLVGLVKDKKITLDMDIEMRQADYKVVVSYTGAVSDVVFKTFRFGFEKWFIANPFDAVLMQYRLPTPANGITWQSTDKEVSQFRWLGYTERFTVVPNAAHVDGKSSAEIRTIEVKGNNELKIPTVYTGQLYCGNYIFNQEEPQQSLRFGSLFDREPLTIKGFYTYKPGEVYYECPDITKPAEVVINEEKTDGFSIRAILYTVSHPDNEGEMLGLDELTSSDRIVAEAYFSISKEVKEFTAFDEKIRFKEGKTFDNDKHYRLALHIVSSKEGNRFSGAPGSLLRIDDLEITTRHE